MGQFKGFPGHVFLHPTGRIPDANDNGRSDLSFADQPGHGLAQVPVHADERGFRIEQILAIVHIENWKTVSGTGAVAGRQPHIDMPGRHIAGGEIGMASPGAIHGESVSRYTLLWPWVSIYCQPGFDAKSAKIRKENYLIQQIITSSGIFP